MRILIVDDDPTIRSVLEAVLEDEGFSTITASNGQEAVDIVRADPPALVLMDLMMPVLSGIDATKAIKGSPDTADVPIIAMSAGLVIREQAEDFPADCMIAKPFDLDVLIDRIHEMLAGK